LGNCRAGSATLTAVLFFGGSLAGRREMTVGDLTSFTMYTGLVGLGMSGLSSWASDTLKASVSARRVLDLVDRQPAIDPDQGRVPDKPSEGDIR
jgi:ABC-type multidrug transport system fused ATPase/permease subunit